MRCCKLYYAAYPTHTRTHAHARANTRAQGYVVETVEANDHRRWGTGHVHGHDGTIVIVVGVVGLSAAVRVWVVFGR